MWVAVDDTDGPDGGCTTYVLTEIIRGALALGLDLIGEPRLVRLNPNVPWKTRGNGALAARFGHGRGRPRVIGGFGRRPVRAFPRGTELRPEESEALARAAWATIETAAPDAPRVDPALVVTTRRPAAALYREAVAEIVPIGRARRSLRAVGARLRVRRSRRGAVGAAAALAWPARRRTYELLTYRRADRIGSARRISVSSVRAAEGAWPDLRLCTDPRTRRLLIAPHTRCPILYGLRAGTPRPLAAARRAIRSEPVDRWLIFVTNQGTGDHLVPRTVDRFPREAAGRVRGRVAGAPRALRGGHVAFAIARGHHRLSCLVFEPTKTLPRIAAALAPGDLVEVSGGRARDGSLHVERLRALRWAPRSTAPAVPPCPSCGRRPGSLGRGRGYRCRPCHRRFPPEFARRARGPPPAPLATFDPTPSARRHLHPWVALA